MRVFVEFDDLATQIWQRFVNLMDMASGRPSRTNFLHIKNAMEQYMIGISEDDVNAANNEVRYRRGVPISIIIISF